MTANEARALMPDTSHIKKEALNKIFSEVEQIAKNGWGCISYGYSGDSWLAKYVGLIDKIASDLVQLGYEVTTYPDMKILTIKW